MTDIMSVVTHVVRGTVVMEVGEQFWEPLPLRDFVAHWQILLLQL